MFELITIKQYLITNIFKFFEIKFLSLKKGLKKCIKNIVLLKIKRISGYLYRKRNKKNMTDIGYFYRKRNKKNMKNIGISLYKGIRRI